MSQSAVDSIGKPEDIAGFVSYLASKESRYMTGTSLSSVQICLILIFWPCRANRALLSRILSNLRADC